MHQLYTLLCEKKRDKINFMKLQGHTDFILYESFYKDLLCPCCDWNNYMTHSSSFYCSYYQANVERELCWFVTAALRSYEHISFDRTLDPATSLFEFFVPESTEKYFLSIMDHFQSEGLIRNLQKLPNRLEKVTEQV